MTAAAARGMSNAQASEALDQMFGLRVHGQHAKGVLYKLCELMPDIRPAVEGELMAGGAVPVRNRWAQRYDTAFLSLGAAGQLTSTSWSSELYGTIGTDPTFGQKAAAETNILQAGALSSNERFLAFQLGFAIMPYVIPTAVQPLGQAAIDDLVAILALLTRRTAAVLKSGGDAMQVLGPLSNWAGPDVGGVAWGTQYYDSAGPVSGSPSVAARPSPLRDMPWLDEPLIWNAGTPQTIALTANQTGVTASAPAANAGLANVILACRVTAVGADQKTIQP